MACETPVNPGNLEFCEGEITNPGIARRLYYIPKRNIVAWPTLPKTLQDGETMGKLATYQGDFTLAANETWKFIDIIETRSSVAAEVQGSWPFKTYVNSATPVVALINEEAAGFSRLAKNGDFVYIFQQKDGKYRIIGNEMYSTNTDVAMNLGTDTADDAGTTLTIAVTDICHAPFYTGSIVTDDGDVNPAPDAP